MISGGSGCSVPSLNEQTYHSITRLSLKRLSARNCNCSLVSSWFLQNYQSTLRKLDLSCNPLRSSFRNITVGISNSSLSVLLLDNINRTPNPGDLYCPWNITSDSLKLLRTVPLKIFSFHSNQLGDYGDLKIQHYAPNLVYLDISYNNFHGSTNLVVVRRNNGLISHNSSLGHHITYQPLGLRYFGLRGLTATPSCGKPPEYRLDCNSDSYLFMEDKFHWDVNHDPNIVDLRLLRNIRTAYLNSGTELATIYRCTTSGNSLQWCFRNYPQHTLALLPCLAGLEECFTDDDIQHLRGCIQDQDFSACAAIYLISKPSIVQCSRFQFDLPNTSLLELLQFFNLCLSNQNGGTCSSMSEFILTIEIQRLPSQRPDRRIDTKADQR